MKNMKKLLLVVLILLSSLSFGQTKRVQKAYKETYEYGLKVAATEMAKVVK